MITISKNRTDHWLRLQKDFSLTLRSRCRSDSRMSVPFGSKSSAVRTLSVSSSSSSSSSWKLRITMSRLIWKKQTRKSLHFHQSQAKKAVVVKGSRQKHNQKKGRTLVEHLARDPRAFAKNSTTFARFSRSVGQPTHSIQSWALKSNASKPAAMCMYTSISASTAKLS